MADLDLALAATFDTSDVVQGGQAGAAAIDNVAKAQKGANQANKEASTAATNAAKAERDLAAATERVKATLDPTYAAQKKLNTALQEAKLAFDNGKISSEQYNRVQSLLNGSIKQTAVSAGSARAGTAQLGQQLQDIGIQAQAGTSIFTIFGQQTGQVGTALQLMGGKLGAVGAFLAGPWGAILTVAISVLGGLAYQLSQTGNAAESSAEQQKKLTDAILDNQKATASAIRTSQQAEQQNYNEAASLLAKAQQMRASTLETLKAAKGRLEADNAGAVGGRASNFGANYVAQNSERDVARLNKAIAEQTKLIAGQEQAVRRAGIPKLQRQAAEATDAAVASTGRYDRALGSLNDRFAAGKITQTDYRKSLEGLNRTRKAEQDSIREGNKKDTSATTAKREAAKAAREQAKAAREAEGANKLLESTLDKIVGRFDPATKAAREYADTLEDIAKLVAGGKLSNLQAGDIVAKINTEQVTKYQDGITADLSGSKPDTTGAKLEEAAKVATRRFEKSADYAADALERGALNVADILGDGKLGRAIGGLLQELGLKGTDPSKNLATQIKKLGNDVLGPENAKRFGESVGKIFQGAQDGQFASSIADKIGIKQSKTGAAIGGAAGSALFGPIGGYVGGLIGGTIGGFFKKTKSGSATLGNVNGEASIVGTSGNSASYRKTASTLGDSVLDSLDSIVSQLGGDLGDFSVSIGQRKKKFVVDSTGSGRTKGSGTTKYDSAEEAAAAALANAIADGAVKGISPAVQRAITGSTDVQKALQDAINVQQLETDIKGIGGKLDGVFSNLDRVAEERLRLARKYGVDIVAVEKLNAEQREKAIADALESRTGALKSLLDDLKFGNLAEGDAFTKRNAVLVEITKAQADAEAGVEGAANKLADLQRQLVEFSKDSFGTAGPEYGNDRASAISSAEKVIQLENERIKLAAAQQETQTNALTTQNELTNEGNNLLAQQNTTLQSILARLSGAGAVGQQMANTVYRQPAVQY